MDKQIIFTEDLPSSTLQDGVRRGEYTRLARGVYTTDVDASPEDVVHGRWREIVGRRFPDAGVTRKHT